jgi:phospholipase C
MRGKWTRREFLAASTAGAAAVGGLTACADDDDRSTATRSGPSTTSIPTARSLDEIEHVVILMQENRSFDHYFGTRKGVRGFADPDVPLRSDGRPIWYQDSSDHPDGYVLPYPLRPAEGSDGCGVDPQHGWIPQHNYWDDGRLGGFASFGTTSLGYYLPEDLPYYAALADEFTLCDHSFCSVIGPTTPNRLYAWTASIDPTGDQGGPVIDNFTGPFRWETYPERLERAGVSWRVYHEVDDFDDNPLKWFAAYQNIPTTSPLYENAIKDRTADAFANDVMSGELPQVSWIVATSANSEHPSYGAPFVGIDFAARTLAALMANEKVWAKSVFILTFDENGGWFDHVPPPVAPPGTPGEYAGTSPIGMGFRVPTIIASPYSRGGSVDHTTFDHTSILRLLETRFGVEIPNITAWRRETSGDFADLLDFSEPDASVPDLPDTSDGQARLDLCRTKPILGPPVDQQLPT